MPRPAASAHGVGHWVAPSVPPGDDEV